MSAANTTMTSLLAIGAIAAATVLIPTTAQSSGCSIMSVKRLGPEHQLSKAGLIHRRMVRQREVGGVEPGDVVFQFPDGRIIHTSHENKHIGYGMYDQGTVPKEANRLEIHKEFLMAEGENLRECGKGGKK